MTTTTRTIMNKLVSTAIALTLLPLTANAAAEVYLNTPNDIQPDGYVVSDGPGIIRWNSTVDPAMVWIASGAGQLFYELKWVQIPSYPFRAERMTLTGVECTDACSFYFKEKYVSPSCPGDGEVLAYPSLTFTLDGVQFYSEPVRVSDVICYVTPPPAALKTWVAPVMTFTNPSQDRAAAATGMIVADAAWLYSQHTFILTGNVSCAPYMLNKGTRWVKRWVESGFVCTSNLEPGEVATVVVR